MLIRLGFLQHRRFILIKLLRHIDIHDVCWCVMLKLITVEREREREGKRKETSHVSILLRSTQSRVESTYARTNVILRLEHSTTSDIHTRPAIYNWQLLYRLLPRLAFAPFKLLRSI